MALARFGRTLNHQFVGGAVERENRDHTGWEGTRVERVQALKQLGTVGNPIAVGICEIGIRPNNELRTVVQQIAIAVNQRQLIQHHDRNRDLGTIAGSPEVDAADLATDKPKNRESVVGIGRQNDLVV